MTEFSQHTKSTAPPKAYLLTKPRLFSIILIIALTFPQFLQITKGFGGSRYFGEILLSFGVFLLLLLGIFGLNQKLNARLFWNTLILFTIFSILLLLALMRDRHGAGIRDVLEFFRPMYAASAFLFASSIQWNEESILRYIVRPLEWIFLGLILYSLFEVLTGPIGFTVSTFLFKDSREVLSNKATGSFGVTYYFGSFMILPLGYYFSRFLFSRRGRLKQLLLFTASLVVILLTQSRTIFLAVICLAFYIFLTYGFYKGLPRKGTFYMIFGALAASVIAASSLLLQYAQIHFKYLYSGLSFLLMKGVSSSGEGSASIRYQQLLWAIDQQDSIPLIGAGVGKGSGILLESFYALYLFRYGIIGIIIYVIFAFFLLIGSYRLYRKFLAMNSVRAASLMLGFHYFIVALPVASLSSVITDQPRMAIMYYGLAGVIFRILSNEKYLKLQSKESLPHA